jgi:hypothetical protein
LKVIHLKKDKLIGIIIFLSGAVSLALTLQIPAPMCAEDPGPRLFPYLGSGLLLISGMGLILKNWAGQGDATPFFTRDGWKRVMLIGGIIIVYGVALHVIGFLISTPVMVYVLLKMLVAGKKLSAVTGVVYSALVTFITFFLFEKMLNILLPHGIF